MSETKILVCVDLQNDFIDGALGTEEARKIVPAVVKKIKNFKGRIIFTRDTHNENYLDTQEGKKLPIPHCIKGTRGWEINKEIFDAVGNRKVDIVDKKQFGSERLPSYVWIRTWDGNKVDSIEFIGLCTDVCVISNALIMKMNYPEIPITVDSTCCAGTTPEAHEAALKVMKNCQINIV